MIVQGDSGNSPHWSSFGGLYQITPKSRGTFEGTPSLIRLRKRDWLMIIATFAGMLFATVPPGVFG